MIWALAYLAFGFFQLQRAEAAGALLAAERGHVPHRLTAKAGFTNLLVWKLMYEHDGRFYVDSIRAGLKTTACPGASIERLDVDRDFPWLDYLALDPAAPNRVIDMRYSLVPNEIDPLWGIDLDPLAAPDEHVRYISDPTARLEHRRRFWELITGRDCR